MQKLSASKRFLIWMIMEKMWAQHLHISFFCISLRLSCNFFMSSSLKPTLIILVTVLAMCACNGNDRYHATLERASCIMNAKPDSALDILYTLEQDKDKFDKADLMRWHLLMLCAQNKCDTVFRTDSLQQMLTAYYDDHGSANDRMMAHYLLGRACSDMGDAPRAIHCYQVAVECADTMSASCDFYNLCSVYGQMATVFDTQHLYKEEIAAYERYSHFSLKDSDIYNHIKGIELQIPPYCALDDTLHCFELTERCHNLYKQHGYHSEAAMVYPTAIFIHIQNGQYAKAKTLMDEMRQKSGLFRENGDIIPGREHFYNSCGLYYLGTGRTDSAEYYFRKLLEHNINRNYEAYRGLARVYTARGVSDSIVKYGKLGESALDSIHSDDQAEAVAITNSMYNYNRYEKLAIQKALETEKAIRWGMFIFAIAIIMAFCAYKRFSSYKKASNEKYTNINNKYIIAERKRTEAEDDLQALKLDSDTALKRKQDEISKLTTDIEKYKQMIEKFDDGKKIYALLNCDTVKSFQTKSKATRETTCPTDKEWHELEILFRQNLPSFYTFVIKNDSITEQEIKVCMLTRLGFSSGRIAILLKTSAQRVTNAKISANNKLFGMSGASSLHDNLKKL